MERMNDPANDDAWLRWIEARGAGPLLLAALDALAPFAPIGAQLLWTAQPALRLFGADAAVISLARTLEDPDGLDALRARLDVE